MLKSNRSILIVRAVSITALLGLALLLPADGALAQINVDPDDVLTDLEADDYDSNCAANCSVSANLSNSTLMASTAAGESETNDIKATLSASFDVSAKSEDPEDETKLVGSTISLTVRADGTLTASGTDSSAGYRLDLQVVDTSEGDMLVATQKIGESSVMNGTEEVWLLEPLVLPVLLTRGHSYSVLLVLCLEAEGDDTPGSASVEFDSTASWEELTIAAGSDIFGAIADLDGRVEELETDVADLREDFENHSHKYLTGKGVGHNNTVATTTTPDFPDGNNVSSGSDDGGSTQDPPPVVEEEDRSGGRGRSRR